MGVFIQANMILSPTHMDYTQGHRSDEFKGGKQGFLLLLSEVLQSAVFKDSNNILKIVIFSRADQLLQL